MHRLLASRHIDTVAGAVAIAAGVLIFVAAFVGFSVLVVAVDRWVR